MLPAPDRAEPAEPDPLAERAARTPGRVALLDIGQGLRLTWLDLDRLASDWAARLGREGAGPGDRVAVVEPAGARLAALLFACLRTGTVLVPLSPRAPEVDLRRSLDDCRARLLLRDGEVVEHDPGSPAAEPGDLCLLYTSGTTGPAKGVRLTAANHLASARGCQQSLAGTSGDRWLCVLSPHHVGGLAILFRSAYSDQPVVTLPRFDEVQVGEALRRYRPTLVSLVPTMLARLLAAGEGEALAACRAILLGGAPARTDQLTEWIGLGLTVCPSYGLTETCSQVATAPPGRAAELGDGAEIHSQAAVQIVDGEIVVSGPVLSPGYWNRDLAGFADGRFFTGDLGFLDGAGRLHVTGRRDDTIITGGENVRPEEVEAVLMAHPQVRDAAVVARPDPTWGQVLEALAVADGIDGEQLVDWCRDRLPGFKVPRRVRFVGSLPRNEGGKLLRRQM
jgi:O-succinylbenzoic acid--CoA ligase